MDWTIRRAEAGDEEAISLVILAALRDTNATDYSSEIIARVAQSFGPSAVRSLINKREVYVATTSERVVGTASRDGAMVRSVFLSPGVQGQGIGRALVSVVERSARDAGLERLTVPATITAEAFYAKLGYSRLREVFHGEERTIIMERVLRRSL